MTLWVLILMGLQTTSKRLADRKIEKFDKNITKRGFVPETTTKKGKDYPVGPILLGFFVFVVIGSCECISSSLFPNLIHFTLPKLNLCWMRAPKELSSRYWLLDYYDHTYTHVHVLSSYIYLLTFIHDALLQLSSRSSGLRPAEAWHKPNHHSS